MYPRQGGGFVFVLEAFGPWAAFFKGWGSFLVGYPASSAAIATILGVYAVRALGLGERLVVPIALAACALVWVLNLRGTRFSARTQTTITAAKVAALALLAGAGIAVGLAAGTGGAAGADAAARAGSALPGIGAFAAAMIGVLWTFDGWQNLCVAAGEVERPEKSLVRALVATIAIVTAIYLAMNVAYLVALPFGELAGAPAPAALVAERALGSAGARVVAALVVLSAFGALFGIAMAAARYFYALGASGLFFASAAAIDPRTQAPRWGSTALFVTSAAYVLTGTFEEIMGFYVSISLLYNVLTVLAVYRLRRIRPDLPRPFRVPGYPVVPALFVVAALVVAGFEIAHSKGRSIAGLAVLLLSWPAYRLWKRRAPS
jgi:amino acid transporter